MLGYAMLLLHETPVLSRDAIRNVLRNLATSNRASERALATSDLADQVEQIKISPQVMTLEEISRFWSALQTPYRPSALYQVSVVLLEMKRSTKSALPVLQRNVYITPFEQPIIETVESSEGDRQPITLDKTLIIKGQRLQADATRVQIGATNIPLNTRAIAETQIQIPLATLEPTVVNTLRAGVQPIQVIHDLVLGTPGDPHRGFESNMAAFVLRPRILRDSGNRYQIQVSPMQIESGGRQIRNVTIALSPVVGQSQRVLLLLNEWQGTRAYSFEAAPRSQDSNVLVIPISASLPAGTYLVRVQIDGADSPLDVDSQPESPNYNQFTGTPNIVIS
ncbi:MAG: Pvc16 family protein, partial [Synechococcales bacterium]|nr:Pvc16 family protein [Synechococcales bacterium]